MAQSEKGEYKFENEEIIQFQKEQIRRNQEKMNPSLIKSKVVQKEGSSSFQTMIENQEKVRLTKLRRNINRLRKEGIFSAYGMNQLFYKYLDLFVVGGFSVLIHGFTHGITTYKMTHMMSHPNENLLNKVVPKGKWEELLIKSDHEELLQRPFLEYESWMRRLGKIRSIQSSARYFNTSREREDIPEIIQKPGQKINK
jgi:hypothetical protein